MSEQNQLTIAGPKASDQLASFLGIEKSMMLETLKVQCFKGKRPDEVSDAQLAAFVSTANVLQVNPLVPGMLFAFSERNGGITPILGPDGVFKKLDEFIASGKLSGFECEVTMGADGKPDHATATIHRKEGQVPAKYTAYYSEWAVTSNPNWQSRPRHMLWVRAIKQAARQVIHGLPMDSDEYEISQMQNVTPEAAPTPERPAPPKRAARGAAAVKENARATAPEVVVEREPEAPAQPEPAPEPAKAVEVAPDPKPAPAAPEPAKIPDKPALKGTLAEGEIYDAVCKVKEIAGFVAVVAGVRQGSVRATVQGEFFGTVFHIGAGKIVSEARKDGDKDIPAVVVAIAPWSVGAELRLRLKGENRTGRIVAVVVSAEVVAEEF